MKMLKSIVITSAIISCVWGAVWAQSLIEPTKKTSNEQHNVLAKDALYFPTVLLGSSKQSSFENADSTATYLINTLVQTPSLFTLFKESEKLSFYLVYQSIANNKLLISSGVDKQDLKKEILTALPFPQGNYQAFAKPTDNINDLEKAWLKLDTKRALHAVVEIYQLNQKGTVISARSYIAYQP